MSAAPAEVMGATLPAFPRPVSVLAAYGGNRDHVLVVLQFGGQPTPLLPKNYAVYTLPRGNGLALDSQHMDTAAAALDLFSQWIGAECPPQTLLLRQQGYTDRRVPDYAAASEVYCTRRDRSGLGMRDFPDAYLYASYAATDAMAYLSYNGRVWSVHGAGTLLYDNRTPGNNPVESDLVTDRQCVFRLLGILDGLEGLTAQQHAAVEQVVDFVNGRGPAAQPPEDWQGHDRYAVAVSADGQQVCHVGFNNQLELRVDDMTVRLTSDGDRLWVLTQPAEEKS